MRFLIVYELVPEETKFYALENYGANGDEEIRKNLELANGHFVNEYDVSEEVDKALEYVSNLLEKATPFTPGTGVVDFDGIYHTGFLL